MVHLSSKKWDWPVVSHSIAIDCCAPFLSLTIAIMFDQTLRLIGRTFLWILAGFNFGKQICQQIRITKLHAPLTKTGTCYTYRWFIDFEQIIMRNKTRCNVPILFPKHEIIHFLMIVFNWTISLLLEKQNKQIKNMLHTTKTVVI